MLAGEFFDRAAVELDVHIVLLAVGEMRVLEVFVGDGREQHEPRGLLAVVSGRHRPLDETLEVLLEFRKSGLPAE